MRSALSLGIFLTFSVILSCTRLEKEKEHVQTLQLALSEKDSLEQEMVKTMEEINKNLDLIREKQGLIISPSNEENLDKKEEILKNISLINSLIEENKHKIEELSKQAEKLSHDNNALSKVAKQTSERIKKQEEEIIRLKQQLAMEEFKVADLNVKMDELQVSNEVLSSEKAALEEANAMFDKDLNKAYFTYGTYQELKEKNIAERKGGMLGIGKRNTLTTAFNRNRSYFSELDIRKTTTIPLQGNKGRLLTFHPEDSYEWKKTSEQYISLEIKNPADFWSISRFLVVEVD